MYEASISVYCSCELKRNSKVIVVYNNLIIFSILKLCQADCRLDEKSNANRTGKDTKEIDILNCF